ncbi:MAG TPA: carboxypeptidase-like regulatory domain-containing protein [Gemmatimonadota bacterium]|nr:carboxypeptidase-like regulatory domain-containing protein [Gemmatimonadota bacterium]
MGRLREGVNRRRSGAVELAAATLLAAAALSLGLRPAAAQSSGITMTVTVSAPKADWGAWSSDPSIAMVMLQSTRTATSEATSTVTLKKDGQTVGQVPGNIGQVSPGTHVIRTPQIAAWSRMTWSGSFAGVVADAGALPPGSYRLCVDLEVAAPPGITAMAGPPTHVEVCGSFSILAPVRVQRAQVQDVGPSPNIQVPPPHLISPASRQDLRVPYPTFQWTPVVSTQFPRPTYLLRIARVREGQTPREALETGQPLFRREVIGTTAFPYPASGPPLEPGETYAWQVQALTMPTGEAGGQIRPLGMNQGRSQVYTFTRTPTRVVVKQRGPAGPVAKKGPLYDHALSGRMTYTFQKSDVPEPHKVSAYLGPIPGQQTLGLGKDQSGGYVQTGQGGGQRGGSQEGGGQGGGLMGGFRVATVNPRSGPLAGVTLRLVVRYRTEKQWIRGSSFSVGGKSYTDNGRVIASARTGDDGRFTFFFHDDLPTGAIAYGQAVSAGSGEFGYHESGANVLRFYMIDVGDPHYASPSDELAPDSASGGDVGKLVALVRTYQLRVKVVRAGQKTGRTGLRVQLLRAHPVEGVPANEGSAPMPHATLQGMLKSVEVIGEDVTGDDGTVTFTNLVKNVGSPDLYQVLVSSEPTAKTAAYYPSLVTVSHAMPLDDPIAWDDAHLNESYRTNRLYSLTVPVEPHPPAFKGVVQRADTHEAVHEALMVLVRHGVQGSMILHGVKARDHGRFYITGMEGNRSYVVYVHSPGFRPDSAVVTPDTGVVTEKIFELTPRSTVTLSLVDEAGDPVPGDVTVGNWKSKKASPVYGNDQGQKMVAYASGLAWTTGSGGGRGGGGGQTGGGAKQGGRAPAGGQAQAGQMAAQGAMVGQQSATARGTPAHLLAYRVTVGAVPGRQNIHVDAGPEYFPTDTTVTLPEGHTDLGKLTVHLRKRRLRVVVVGLKHAPAPSGGGGGGGGGRRGGGGGGGFRVMHVTSGPTPPPIEGALVRLPNESGQPSATTDANGIAEFEWKGTSDRVDVQITPPAGSDYMSATPQVDVPESPTFRKSVLGLAPAASVTGTVYAGEGTDQPVAGARVFVPGVGPGGGDLADTTDAQGHYTLHAAPTGSFWILAGKAGSDYTGDSAQVNGTAGEAATQDFHLTAVDGLPTQLLGLPIEVQSYRKTAGGAVLSGRFTGIPSNDAFAPEAQNLTLAFDSVEVTGTGKDAAPEGGVVRVAESDLPLGLFGKYLVLQHAHGGLEVRERGQGEGAVVGPVALLPGSFPINSAELVFGDSLHLLLPGASGSDRTRIATLVAGGASPAPSSGYDVGTSAGGNPKLTVYGFDADGSASSSHLTAGSLRLDATLHTAIPGVGDLAIEVPELTVKPGQGSGAGLQPAQGDQTLSLKMGKWTLESPSWSLHKGRLNLVHGAIQVPLTDREAGGHLDFPFTGMDVTPTTLEGGSFGGGPILLGGFVPLDVTGNITFLRDSPTGPWKLFGDGGRIDALPGMAASDHIDVDGFDFYSSGDKIFSMVPGATVRLFGTGDLAVSTLGFTESTVSFAGPMDLHVPGLDPQAVVIDYTNEGPNGTPMPKFNPIDLAPFDIGGPKVSVKQGTLDASGFHGDGTVSVPGKFSVASTFTRTPLGPNQKIQALPKPGATLDVGQVAISKLTGGAKASGGKWATDYGGHMDVGGQVSGDITIGVEGADVTAGTGGLAVKNIPTPFGNMAITMNFPEQRLEGSVQTDKDIAAGAHVKGASEMVISGKPSNRYWYFFTGAAFTLKTPHMSGKAALLLGSASLSGELLARFESYGRRPVPGQFHVINGFYMEGEAEIPVPICPNGAFDIGIASVEVWCDVWGDVRLGGNFQQANTYYVGVGAGIDAGVKGGVGMGLCVHISAEVKAALDGEGAYRSDGAWFARGRADFDLLGSASYGVGLDDICLDHTTSVHIGLGAEAQLGYDWASNVGPHTRVFFK